MIEILFSGCSFFAGTGLSDEKDNYDQVCNVFCREYFYDLYNITNIAKSGNSNLSIYLSAVQAMSQTHYDYVFVGQLLGPHKMDSGALLESHYPYPMHVDTHDTFEDYKYYLHNKKESCLDIAVLISLNEDTSFKTVIFDYFADKIDLTQIPPGNSTVESFTHLDINLDHFSPKQSEFVKNLKISTVYNWTQGGLVLWPRQQLHCSSNFYPTGRQKKAIVLFL